MVDAKGNLILEKDTRVIRGYAIIWGDVNQHNERVHRGACAQSINAHGPASSSNYKIKFMDRHGKALANVAVLKEDEVGLYFETAPLDNIRSADEVLTQLASGTLNNFSYGFDYVWDENKMKLDDAGVLNLFEIRLFEISIVDIPSGLETYAIRGLVAPGVRGANGEINLDEKEVIDTFISKLPKKYALEARKVFAFQRKTLLETSRSKPALGNPKSRNKTKESKSKGNPQAKKQAVDYKFLLKQKII